MRPEYESPSSSYKISYITRNGANQSPTQSEAAKVKEKLTEGTDAILVATQEESRDLGKSLAMQLANKTDGKKNVLRRAFNTMTGMNVFGDAFGCVSQTALSNHEISARGSRYQHAPAWYKAANKGGEYASITVSGNTVYSAAVHLDSKSFLQRAGEARAILGAMDAMLYRDAETVRKKRIARAITPVFFGGDINCRTFTTPNTASPISYFECMGFSLAGDETAPSYAGKNTHKKKVDFAAASNEDDPSRALEKRGGKLDRVYFRGPVELIDESVVEGTNLTSDHKAVVANFTVRKIHSPQEEFEASKKDIVKTLDAFMQEFSDSPALNAELSETKEAVKSLNFLDDNSENEKYLDAVFEQCEQLENSIWEIKLAQAKALDLQAKAAKQEKETGIWASVKNIFRDSPKKYEKMQMPC